MRMDEYWTGRDGMDYDDEEFEEDYYDDYDDEEPDFELDSWRGFEV